MKSNKQRKAEIRGDRAAKAAKATQARAAKDVENRHELPFGTVPCDPLALAPTNSYGVPDFVALGHYVDAPFACRDCGKQEIWRATQQKWWYEIAKGSVESRANRCNACRRKERERVVEARRVHLEGLAAKQLRQARS